MIGVQDCLDQAAQCQKLMKSASGHAEAETLKNLSNSWKRLAGQIDRYNALMRQQDSARSKIERRDLSGKNGNSREPISIVKSRLLASGSDAPKP